MRHKWNKRVKRARAEHCSYRELACDESVLVDQLRILLLDSEFKQSFVHYGAVQVKTAKSGNFIPLNG